MKVIRWTFLLVLFAAIIGRAEDPDTVSETVTAPQDDREVGIFYTALGAPYPALLGFGLGFSIIEFVRFELAIGTTNLDAEIPTISVGMKYQLVKRKISPVFGLHVSSGKENSERPRYGDWSYSYRYSPAERRGIFPYFTVGFDIRTSKGATIMVGTSWGLTKRNGTKQLHPYFGVGLSF